MANAAEMLDSLTAAIERMPLVDAHAHNIVEMESSMDFLQAFTEAQVDHLRHVPYTLCFKRSVRDISELYGVEADLEAITMHRKKLGLEAITSHCFHAANISTLLLDDGLSLEKKKGIAWHKTYIPSVHRVLRIETIAEDVLKQIPPGGVTWTLNSFGEHMLSLLNSLSNNVVAFKSIAAYRSGLDIDPMVSFQEAEQGLMEDLATKPLRIKNKALVDFIFVLALELASSKDIPVQIHTGFGDKDLDLRLTNPLHLRRVLEDKRFSHCRLVLLHASYPYVQQASFMAHIYPQVFLDFGLAVPKLSVQGMKSTISQLLELAPLDKIMFSTDGYAFPETFYLGTKWARNILIKVLSKSCRDGDLSLQESLEAAEGILRRNALSFYNLEGNLDAENAGYKESKHIYEECTILEKEKRENGKGLMTHTQKKLKHVRLVWSDGSGQIRCRVVPIGRFNEVVQSIGVGLAKCAMAMSAGSDGPADGSGFTPVGEIRLMPDLSTMQKLPWNPQHAIVFADMHLIPGKPWEYCPRSTLLRVANILDKEFQLTVRVGSEHEFYLLKPSSSTGQRWKGLDSTRYCSFTSFDGVAPLLEDIYDSLTSLGIQPEQMHAEAGSGQFEISIGHQPLRIAADNILLVRETIKSLSNKHGCLATFLPKYFPDDIGSGSHIHASLWHEDTNKFTAEPHEGTRYGMSKVGEEFLAGVLCHLPAIMAFTAPHPNSYQRIQPHTWSGAYKCWGNNNKEAALRIIPCVNTSDQFASNFELKTFDGCANPHLGLAAVIAAGIDGLRNHQPLPQPIDVDPTTLAEGLLTRLPISLDEAVIALENDHVMQEILGAGVVKTISAIRRVFNCPVGFSKV